MCRPGCMDFAIVAHSTPGYFADVVVFDPATVRTGDVHLRDDMPEGEFRLFAEAEGIDYVFVNGTGIVDHGK